MAQNQGMGLPQEFHEQIVMASCMLLNSMQDVLKPSPTPGRCHYQFNLRDITRVFQVTCRLLFLSSILARLHRRFLSHNSMQF